MMGWGFSTESEFQPQLNWIDAFVREPVNAFSFRPIPRVDETAAWLRTHKPRQSFVGDTAKMQRLGGVVLDMALRAAELAETTELR